MHVLHGFSDWSERRARYVEGHREASREGANLVVASPTYTYIG
jgi:hypothetical protein